MTRILSSLTKSLISSLLVLSIPAALSFVPHPMDYSTLVLVYDETTSVFDCIQEPVGTQLDQLHTVTITVPSSLAESKIQTYSQCSGIQSVTLETTMSPALIPGDPSYAVKQWNLSDIHLEEAWDITTGSESIVVAVIDTGVTTDNPVTDFKVGTVLLGASVLNGVILEDTTLSQYSYDGVGHGTAVASVIAADMNSVEITGIAPMVKILPMKVFPDKQFASDQVTASSTDIALAIVYATDHGADIINLSLGGSSPDPQTRSAVEYAYSHGVILVASSGNASNLESNIVAKVSYPAGYPQVIAVGSLSETRAVSNFTSIDFTDADQTALDLSAYGEWIYLPYLNPFDGNPDGFAYWSGTSFSAPTVTGVLALMKSVYPDLSPRQAKAILLSGVTDITDGIYSSGWDIYTGYGMLDAYQAILKAQDYASYFDTNTDKASAQFVYGRHDYNEGLRPVLDTDYFTFTLLEPDDVTITVSPGSIEDLMFEVFDPDDVSIGVMDDWGSGHAESIQILDLPIGTYSIKVTDYADRAYASTYTVNVDYESAALPLISASTKQGPLISGQSTALAVTLSVIESLYHTISVTKDGLPIDVPSSMIFEEWGEYTVTVDDFTNPPVTFDFTILAPEGYQPSYKVSLIGQGAILSVLNGTDVLPLEGLIDQNAILTISLEKTSGYRLYQVKINGVVQALTEGDLSITIRQTSLTITIELGLVGDLNMTDDVTTTDLVLLRRYLAGLETLSDKAVFNCDMNLDTNVTTTDLVKLRRTLAGLE